MFDFGFNQLALIGAVALVVLGPEKLPRVARTFGHLFGKAQRYMADVKAEVNRSIELDELKKMKTQFEDAARGVEETVRKEVDSASAEFDRQWGSVADGLEGGRREALDRDPFAPLPPAYKNPKKNWRLKRGATPQWYKQRQGIRTRALSGAARVARFRPRGLGR
jgi:sec-independent protein translocase protein TatB